MCHLIFLLAVAALAALPAAGDQRSPEQLIDGGQLAEARQAIRELAAQTGQTPRLALLEAMILHREKRYRDSLAVLAPFEKAFEKDPRFFKLAGLNLVLAGSVAPAGPYFQRAVELQPADALTRYYLGLWLLKVRRRAEAETELRRSLALDPAHPDTHLMLGLALDEQGRAEDALRSYAEAARLANLRAAPIETPYLYAGRLLASLGRLEESREQFESATAVRPASVDAWFELGKTLEKLERFDCALDALARAAELAPSDSRPRYRRMMIYRKLGDRTAEKREAALLSSRSASGGRSAGHSGP